MQGLIDRYGTSGDITIQGVTLSIINIPMMSDDEWNRLAQENAVSNYSRELGKEPASVEYAVKWQRERVAERERTGKW